MSATDDPGPDDDGTGRTAVRQAHVPEADADRTEQRPVLRPGQRPEPIDLRTVPGRPPVAKWSSPEVVRGEQRTLRVAKPSFDAPGATQSNEDDDVDARTVRHASLGEVRPAPVDPLGEADTSLRPAYQPTSAPSVDPLGEADTSLRRAHQPSSPPPEDDRIGFEPTRVRASRPAPVPWSDSAAAEGSGRRRSAAPTPFDDLGTAVRPVSSDSDPLIGAMLGEYRVLAPLGSGGVGLVYRGEQPVIGRPVAIKVLKAEYARDPNHARRFLEEARSVSAARHPGIIDVFSFGQTPAGVPYLVMELLEGEPLDALLARRGSLPPKEALSLLIPMLNALSAAHAAGVIHRDLKPGNVFIVQLRDGTTFPKLLDFGLARRGEAGAMVRQTSVGGTPLYIAPEQLRGEAVGARTDLYSLGCLAYEMVVGAPPFTAVNLHELLDQHLTLAPPPLRARAPSVPVEFERLVLRMLAKDPLERPATALEVREQLERIQASVATGAPRTARPRPARSSDEVSVSKRAPARTAVSQPVMHEEPPVEAPKRAWWPFALGAVVVLGVVAVLAWPRPDEVVTEPVPRARPIPTPIPMPVPEPEPVAPEPAPTPTPEVAPPAPVEVAPKDPKPPVGAKPRHTPREVRKKWRELRQRARALPDDLRRAAELQLDEARFCTAGGDECWRELSDIEKTFFAR
jgi:serine/threonine-protein kinase